MNYKYDSFLDFLYDWQTLAGSFLGVFVAALVSLISFYIKNRIDARKRKREALRRIEISMTRSLNDMDILIKSLLDFIDRVNNLTKLIAQELTDNRKYFLQETNFPPLSIFLDSELPNMITKSYYVHNKILVIDMSLKAVNASLAEMKENFLGLSRKNEFLVSVKAEQFEQKTTYLGNLKDFRRLVEKDFIQDNLLLGVRTMLEVKVYNDKLRKSFFCSKWKYEGFGFIFSKPKKEWSKYYQSIEMLDRIDLEIKKEVDALLLKLPYFPAQEQE